MFSLIPGKDVSTGSMESSTVTVAKHVAVFVLLSVTVKVTIFGPTFVQSKAVISNDKFAIQRTSQWAL